jgi:hypothetical protein
MLLLAASDGTMGNAAAPGEARQEKLLRTELVKGTVTEL